MANFELFMCSLGNGLTVCNKAVMEHGDYKQIAHISPAGNIKWYVPVGYVPGPDPAAKISCPAQMELKEEPTHV